MSDSRLQELRKAWKASGSVEDEAAYLRERVRGGDLTVERLALAARCGHAAAGRVNAPPAPLAPLQDQLERLAGLEEVDRWVEGSTTPVPELLVHLYARLIGDLAASDRWSSSDHFALNGIEDLLARLQAGKRTGWVPVATVLEQELLAVPCRTQVDPRSGACGHPKHWAIALAAEFARSLKEGSPAPWRRRVAAGRAIARAASDLEGVALRDHETFSQCVSLGIVRALLS
ncbi:MAG: hypothetical protein R3F62_31865 [Planctomycetota bacterium]